MAIGKGAPVIDQEKIPKPHIDLSTEAALQLRLIRHHDPLHISGEKCLRIHVEEKGCQGFTYALGEGTPLPEDFVIDVGQDQAQGAIPLHLDPFCAFYLQKGHIDYVVSESGEDGFIVSNPEEAKFKGKFWKGKEELLAPPLKKKVSHA